MNALWNQQLAPEFSTVGRWNFSSESHRKVTPSIMVGKLKKDKNPMGGLFRNLAGSLIYFEISPSSFESFLEKNLHGLIHTFIDLSGWFMLFRKASFSSLNFPVLVRAGAKKTGSTMTPSINQTFDGWKLDLPRRWTSQAWKVSDCVCELQSGFLGRGRFGTKKGKDGGLVWLSVVTGEKVW